MSEPVIDAEVVDEAGTEMEVRPAPAPSTLFRTDDPATVLERATATANSLAPVLTTQNMLSDIQGKKHVKIEGWTTLGSMLGVTAVGVWTKPTENGWEAKVNAQTLDGRVIGSAEAMCTRDESRWKSADDYAIRSMAQTRASSKALASVLRFVVTLAGFSGTPAEEMDGVRPSGGSSGSKSGPSPKQLEFFESLVKDAGSTGEGLAKLMAWAAENLTGGKGGSMSKAIDGLKDKGKRSETCDRLETAANEWALSRSDATSEPYEAEQAGDSSDLPFDSEGIEF